MKTLTTICLLVASSLAAAPLGRVALVTDYGWDDFYVGALKGAMVSANPDVIIDDLTHSVPSFDVAGGSFLLAAAAREFPAGTVVVAIVDPGVGTARRPVALRTENGLLFVGPDNGLFTHVIHELGLSEAREITNDALLRPDARSTTFHGRDIFGPIGARLAGGLALSEVGPVIEDLTEIPVSEAREYDGAIQGQILLADHYGNLLTNVPQALLGEAGIAEGAELILVAGDQSVAALLVRTYGDVAEGEPCAVINSLGQLEFALNQGSLAERLGAKSGDLVRVRRKN